MQKMLRKLYGHDALSAFKHFLVSFYILCLLMIINVNRKSNRSISKNIRSFWTAFTISLYHSVFLICSNRGLIKGEKETRQGDEDYRGRGRDSLAYSHMPIRSGHVTCAVENDRWTRPAECSSGLVVHSCMFLWWLSTDWVTGKGSASGL